MHTLVVILVIPVGLVGGLISGFAYGVLLPGTVVPDGLLPLLMAPLGAWVAGYGVAALMAKPRRGRLA